MLNFDVEQGAGVCIELFARRSGGIVVQCKRIPAELLDGMPKVLHVFTNAE